MHALTPAPAASPRPPRLLHLLLPPPPPRPQECCQPYHKSAVLAPDTPEKLVKARYSACVKRDAKFLRSTSHPDNPALKGSSATLADGTTKQCSYEEDLAVTFLSVEFQGLRVLSTTLAPAGDTATVDVEARFKRVVSVHVDGLLGHACASF